VLCLARFSAAALSVALLVACHNDNAAFPPLEPARSFSVGGSVAGLAETRSLRLLNNAGDELTVTGSGSFAFSAPVTSNYAVTIASQPLWKSCEITAASGTASSNIDNVAVTCAEAQAAVTTLAGSSEGFQDGAPTEAKFSGPVGVAIGPDGAVYVADQFNNVIRKIGADGVVSTLAGIAGGGGFADGPSDQALFKDPSGVAVDSKGNVFVAEYGNPRIRMITPDGVVSTFAGSATKGRADGIGTAASFDAPHGIAVDANDNLYVSDWGNHLIRKITPLREVSTLAGSGNRDFADGTGASASFDVPLGVAVDRQGNVYVADTYNHRIRKITAEGLTTTLAGSATPGSTNADQGANARFDTPYAVAVDADGYVYVADTNNNLIRRVSPTGVTTTLAGSSTEGSTDGTGSEADFAGPSGIAVAATGVLYVSDNWTHLIRKITPMATATP
jgi:serine/threonine protein kinase, bacterial